jgi:exodeoxyribonuclease VII small subunit
MRTNKKLTYTQAIDELEGIIEDIETESIDVDALARKVKRAAYLINFCKINLRNTEEEVKKTLSEIEEKVEADEIQDTAREPF